MKTMTKKILICLMAAMILLAFAGCNNEEDFEPDLSDLPEIKLGNVDFAEEIENFQENHFNVLNLDAGDREEAYHASFVLSSGGKCYSSDESVATINKKGVVTAQGKGACYVITVGNEFMGEHKVEVTKVVVGASNAMILGGMFDGMDKEAKAMMSTAFTVMGVLLGLGVIAIIVIVIVVRKNNKTTEPGFEYPHYSAPSFTMPEETPAAPAAPDASAAPVAPPAAAPFVAFCPECGQKLETKTAFCPYCGQKL